MDGAYAEHVLDAKDVCSNCFLLVRTERIDPTKAGLLKEYQKRYERHPTNTQIGYGPAEGVSKQKGVFCNCGVEGVYPSSRIWTGRVGHDCFKEYLVNCFETLTEKDVSLDRDAFVQTALAHYRDGDTVDVCFSRALETALAVDNAATA